jgi:hypothetical protein
VSENGKHAANLHRSVARNVVTQLRGKREETEAGPCQKDSRTGHARGTTPFTNILLSSEKGHIFIRKDEPFQGHYEQEVGSDETNATLYG